MRLIDADKLKEELSYKSPAPSFDMDSVILGVIDEQPTVNPWHRVEDELPPYGQDVLAARLYGADVDGWAHEIIIAHICNIRDSVYWNATNVTHWMPLPEPPKEDA